MKILVVDDERNIVRTLTLSLESDGHEVAVADHGAAALRLAKDGAFDLAFLDLRLGGEDGLEVLARLLTVDPGLAIVLITAHASIPTAVEAMRLGAADYVPKPFTPGQIRLVVERLAQTRRLRGRVAELEALVESGAGGGPAVELHSEEPAMARLLELAWRAAASPRASILLLGESGTGKSVLARALHGRGPRADQPFVTVSCPSLSRDLLESELFGHVKGAFTGATANTRGKVAAAAGGTLYLDEVGELPTAIQPKLLRLLQEREYERVGETETRHADVRIISSTNRDLSAAVTAGAFREDLLYRLNTITLTLPPLRERPRDLESLAAAHLAFFARQIGRPLGGFSAEAAEALRCYAWPGNLRELRNAIERAVILGGGGDVGVADLPDQVRSAVVQPRENTATELQLGGAATLAQIEDEHIQRVLARTTRLDDAALILGIDPATLYRKRRRLGDEGKIRKADSAVEG